jgi:hypothetical protein
MGHHPPKSSRQGGLMLHRALPIREIFVPHDLKYPDHILEDGQDLCSLG